METKPFFMSVTFWGLLISLFGMVGPTMGVPWSAEDSEAAQGTVNAGLEFVGLIVAFVGRMKAKKSIGIKGTGKGLALVLILVPLSLGLSGCGSMKAIFTPWGAQEEAVEKDSEQIKRAIALKRQIICMESGGCLTEAQKTALKESYTPLILAADQAKKDLKAALYDWAAQPPRTPKPTAVIMAEGLYSARLDGLEKVLDRYEGDCPKCPGPAQTGGEK